MTDNNSVGAAELAAFYRGANLTVAPPAEPAVRGGVYSPAEAEQARAELNAPIEPGSWRDLEMRGVPTIQWPEDVMAQFIEDQSKPQPPIWNDPALAARRAAAGATAAKEPTITADQIPTVLGPPDYSAVINELVGDLSDGSSATVYDPKMLESDLAEIVVQVLKVAGRHGLDLGRSIATKIKKA